MIDRKEKYRIYASFINEDQKKIIGTVIFKSLVTIPSPD